MMRPFANMKQEEQNRENREDTIKMMREAKTPAEQSNARLVAAVILADDAMNAPLDVIADVLQFVCNKHKELCDELKKKVGSN